MTQVEIEKNTMPIPPEVEPGAPEVWEDQVTHADHRIVLSGTRIADLPHERNWNIEITTLVTHSVLHTETMVGTLTDVVSWAMGWIDGFTEAISRFKRELADLPEKLAEDGGFFTGW